jgi:hypothetical protein
MAKTYEGNLNLAFNKGTNMLYLQPSNEGKYNATNICELVASAMAFCDSNPKATFNRWDFYIPNVNQTLDRDSKELPQTAVKDAIDRGDTATLGAGKWGKPKVTIAGPVKHIKKADDNIVLL